MPHFLDTNVFLRYFIPSDPAKAQRAKLLLERVERGEEKVFTSILVVFEVIFTLQGTYKVPKHRIREMVGDVLSLRGLQLPGKRLFVQALDFYAEQNISFVDAYNVAYMQVCGLTAIYSWDTDFDKMSGLRRVEP